MDRSANDHLNIRMVAFRLVDPRSVVLFSDGSDVCRDIMRIDASGCKQNARRVRRCAGKLGISAYDGGRCSAVNEQHELHGQALRMSYLQPIQQFEKPAMTLVPKGESDLVRSVIRIFQLDDGVDERTTAKLLVGKASLEMNETLQYLLFRWPLGDGNGYQSTSEIGGDEAIFGREIVVQRPLADPDFRSGFFHADPPDALAIKQTVHRFEDPLLHSSFTDEPIHSGNQFSMCRAGLAGSATHDRRKTPVIITRDISFSEKAGKYWKC